VAPVPMFFILHPYHPFMVTKVSKSSPYALIMVLLWCNKKHCANSTKQNEYFVVLNYNYGSLLFTHFVALFSVLNPIGTVPIFVGLTQNDPKRALAHFFMDSHKRFHTS
jgi:hypothetical protein